MVCGGFREWLVFLEARQEVIAPQIVHSYELGFQQGLDAVIARTKDGNLRREFEKMRDGIRTGKGTRGFADYAVACMLRHGLARQFNLADCLAYIYEQLLGERKRNGQPTMNLFAGFDESRPYESGQNPLEARYKVAVGRLVRAIAAGRIRRLRNVEPRPAGTLSIYGGRDKGYISPDEIPGRSDAGFGELVSDIITLLQQRQRQSTLPLVDLFQSVLAGEGTRVQRSRFGHNTADMGRRVIIQVIDDYARRTGNISLLRLLDKIANPEPKEPRPPRQPPTPRVPHGDADDYRSIVNVLEKSGKRVATLALLGSKRSRWLGRPPRDPTSPHRNRLIDVLARMVADGVLAKNGAAFVPGPRYQDYLGQPVLQNQ